MANEKKKGKIQFVFLNLEADEETLQEALRQAGVLMSRGTGAPQRTLIAVPVKRELTDGGEDNNQQQEVYEVIEDEPQAVNTETNGASSTAKTSKPKKDKKPPKTPALLKDFDPNDAETSFEDFVAEKDTSNQFNKYLVIAAWFKQFRQVDEIGTSHIYTCYRLMKWDWPINMAQPFQDMRRLHEYFENGSKSGLYAITIVGLKEVNKMKGKPNSEE